MDDKFAHIRHIGRFEDKIHATEITEISRLSLHDQVALRLRTLLVEGAIPPGAKLNERELCTLLKVSRTPLREAIKLLASEGLVDLLPNRGAVAVKLTETDVIHSFELLAELEGMAGDLAAQRITDAELAELRALHFEMMASYAREDLPSYYHLNALIHSALIRASKNPLLIKTYNNTNARVQSLRYHTNHDAEKWKLAVKEHENMIEALTARDSIRLRKILTVHLQHKRDTVIDLLRTGKLYPDTQSTP
ncbi:GntR family transcriptional regulator [Pusillimonas sp. ANT_WB101]|uniref:GntR family transcriptional regulator n=1 Tax=Pusillimonas sp. ANT_WB101 TaxID=2597356 RepID=UPI0011EF8A02|nr:GntR family transcriptional regulator [Pusillimonas sp. ANT_WB101]KAA0889993.1 GntR family transcriptional regulator [Pusillimonas sp. ANT_WB101]